MTTGVNLLVGYLAGVVAVTGTTPLDMASTKLQAGTVQGSLAAVLWKTFQQRGLPGLYDGYGYNLALCTNPAISNTLFDQIKGIILQRQGPSATLSSFHAFVLGAFTKSVAILVTYPLTFLKTLLQAGRETTSSRDSLESEPSDKRRRFKTLAVLYSGLGAQLLKGVLQAALLYMAKERIEVGASAVVRLLVKLLRVRSARASIVGPA
mmetsp:Transcript_123589/g.394859  ORF Transcript_123589/g.394859 Transcript_123589/m.394859 type:complete len:208 (-) Transcript_123589:85-708(-)